MTTYTVDNETFDTYDEANNYCYEQEIIYYSEAIKYLAREDDSLHESIGLATDIGYEIDGLNSELLATIHYQNYLMESIAENED
jgi:hypothetical protein